MFRVITDFQQGEFTEAVYFALQVIKKYEDNPCLIISHMKAGKKHAISNKIFLNIHQLSAALPETNFLSRSHGLVYFRNCVLDRREAMQNVK